MVGAYVCPRGVYLARTAARRGIVEVVGTSDHPAPLETAADAARHLTQALAAAGLARAHVAVSMRGFGFTHHVISLPPAREAMLAPIIARELRRLEPELADPVVGWLPLPDDQSQADAPGGAMPQRQYLVAAVSRDTADLVERQLAAQGHRLHHLTAIPAAFQRIAEEFEANRVTTALLAPLPDGLLLGLVLGGGIRIAIEPPLAALDAPDPAAMAEETELGATYVRQQFRGAELERAMIVGPAANWTDAESLINQRLGIPVERLDIGGVPAPAIAAFGAVLDARSPAPLALGGIVARRRAESGQAVVRNTAYAAVAATVVIAAWAMFQAIQARTTDRELRAGRLQLEQLSSSLGPFRQTAEQRRLIREGTELLRITRGDRAEVQMALAAISGVFAGAVQLDSLALDRGPEGWTAALVGTSVGPTTGAAVQALHDLYRDLPRRIAIRDLGLGQMAYGDTAAADGRARIVFQLAFVIPYRTD